MATKRKTQAAVKPAPAAAVKLASLRATKAAQLSPGTRENIQRGRTVAHLLWLKLVATISPEARELLFMFNGLVKDYEDVFPADVELSVPAFHPVSVAEQLERAEHLLTGFDREMIRRDESGRLAQLQAGSAPAGAATGPAGTPNSDVETEAIDSTAEADDPNNTPQARAKAQKDLAAFCKLYPPELVKTLGGNVVKITCDRLEAKGMNAESKFLEAGLFFTDWYVRLYANGEPTPEQAYKFMRWFSSDDLHAQVADIIRAMHGRNELDLW